MTTPAAAQHVDENVVAESSDAFGKAVGNEKTGLYSSEDVRGFSPLDAGNARIEGLYFDQSDRVAQRVLDSTTIRVGISAQHYPFPAPTGIVAYDLRKPGDRFEASFDGEYGEYGGPRGAVELKIPLDGGKLGVMLGAGARHQVEAHGGSTSLANFAGLVAWHPYRDAEVLAFVARSLNGSEEARPTIFPAGDHLPPRIPRRQFFGQKWAEKDYNIRTLGLVAKLPLGKFRLETGLFESLKRTKETFADFLTGVDASGHAANRTIVADGNNLDRSTSGEVRLVREWVSDKSRHSLSLSIRGRDKRRLFGGTRRLGLGPSSVMVADYRPRPAFTLGPENTETVRQGTYGIAYSGEWARRGSLDVSLSRSHYRKAVDFIDPLRTDAVARDRPLLWNVNASVIVTSRLAFYAGYVEGQEEALIAPEIAVNRSEAPPAIRTRQVEAGLRFAFSPLLSLVAGVFSVRKPYYNLDPALEYRQLGSVENSGVEVSLAGQLAPGLTAVAGAVFVDPVISGEAVNSGLIGKQPVASSRHRTTVDLDWRMNGGNGPLSFDFSYEGRGKRAANASNTFSAPARHTIDVGSRYRFDLLGAKALVRVLVKNLFNEYRWGVSPSGGFSYSNPRTATIQFLADF